MTATTRPIGRLDWTMTFATLQITGGIGWSVHLWLGAIVLAGAIGLMLDEVMRPPATSSPRPARA